MAADDRRSGHAADEEWTDAMPSGPPLAGDPPRPTTDTPPPIPPGPTTERTSSATATDEWASEPAETGSSGGLRLVGANAAVVAIALVSALLLVVGTFLPWMRYDVEAATPETQTVDFDGWEISQDAELFTAVALIAAAIAGGLLFARNQTLALVLKLGLIVAGAVAIGVAILDIADVQTTLDIPGVRSTVRYGLYLIVFAAIGLLASGAAVRWRDLDAS